MFYLRSVLDLFSIKKKNVDENDVDKEIKKVFSMLLKKIDGVKIPGLKHI